MGEADLAQARSGSTEETDTALVRRMRERAADAWAEVYDRYAPGIHRFAFARLGDVGAAEDMVVETMVGVARDIRRFDPRRSSLAAWVYGIARRRVMLELRRRRRQKSVPAGMQVSAEALAGLSDGSDLAGGTAARLDAHRKVGELRSLLSDAEVEVLVLSCVEELSAREIGQVIGRSERAVHSILHRARKKARERLVGDE